MIGFFRGVRVQRRAWLAALAVLGALGFLALTHLPAGILPEVTFPRISVIADAGERPAEEMLRMVTRPLEASLRRVPDVREIRSTTSRGSTEIHLDGAWNVDMNLMLQRVQARLDAVRGDLPAGAAVEARLMSPAQFPILGLSLTSRTHRLVELRDLAELILQPELARLPGVSDVVIQGGRRPEARVTLDPAALQARGLDATAVADVIRASGVLESVGLLEANHQLYLGLIDARPADLTALENLPIPTPRGSPVPLKALGRVTLDEAPEFTRHVAHGGDAVLVNVLRRPDASTLGVGVAVANWFAIHKEVIPRGVAMEVFYDQSHLVRSSIDSVRDSLLVGGLIAILVVALFLGSLRLGLAGAAVLPGSIALTLLGLSITHQSLNMMTLGGIAAAVGLVLDDAIVVVEHLAHRAADQINGVDVPAAMAEIFPSLLGSTLCTIAVFVPFAGLDGVTGAFFRVLSLSMTLMLSSSLLLCLTLVPMLTRPRARRAARPHRLSAGYDRFIDRAVRHRWVGLVPVLLLLAACVPLLATIGTGFLPEMDEGSLILDYATPPGTSLVETDAMLRRVDHEIDITPEIETWSRRTGDQLGFFITEPNTGDYVLQLRTRRKRSAAEIADDLRARVEAAQPAIQVEFGHLIEDVIGDLTTAPQPIEIRIFGQDRSLLQERALEVAARIEKVNGVVDVRNGVVVSGPSLSVVPGPGAHLAGLGADDLMRAVQPAVAGIDASQIPRGARAWPVRVLVARPSEELAGLAELRVPLPAGGSARLGDVATLTRSAGETEIVRDNQQEMSDVTARLSGRDIGSAVRGIQALIARDVALPPGMHIEYGGLFAEQQSSFRGLLQVLIGAAAAVFLILLISFRSWTRSASVLLVCGASLAGVFLALRVSGATLNISSYVGAIMLVGIVAENAYFVVAEYLEGLRHGATPGDAAVAAARRRTRPVLMTTVAGIAALAPLALGVGSGSALLKPLAIAVVGGFLNSAPLVLFVLPALLAHTGGLEPGPAPQRIGPQRASVPLGE